MNEHTGCVTEMMSLATIIDKILDCGYSSGRDGIFLDVHIPIKLYEQMLDAIEGYQEYLE